MYLLGFLSVYYLCYSRRHRLNWTKDDLSDALFYCVLGVIGGGRVGYMLFYNFSALLDNPLSMFYIWQGGMSFHGGLLGVTIAFLLLAKKKNINPFDLADFASPAIPIGFGLGRFGNFINGELWGKPTNSDWGVIFPNVDLQPRHPSQLYEMLLEGLLLFIILWLFSAKIKPRMATSGLLLLGYGLARFLVEFVRVPDSHLGYLIFDWMTMGQILSLPMVVAGMLMIIIGYKNNIIPDYRPSQAAAQITQSSQSNQ